MAAGADKSRFVEAMVSVGVYGVAGLIFGQGSQDLPSPMVRVTAFSEVRETKSEANCRECTLNYDFVYTRRCKFEELMKADVLVEVYHSGWTGQELLGRVTFSNELVYAQQSPKHMVSRGWFPCGSETNPAETMGFVELSVGVFIAGDAVGRAALDDNDQVDEHGDLKSRVVRMPNPASLNLYQLSVRILKARSLMKVAGLVSEGCDPFVEVEFNGVTQRTKTISNSTEPSWNEEVNVPFMHPCWDSDFAIKVYSDGGVAHGHTLLGRIDMNTDDVQHEMQPTWFYFHSPPMSSLFTEEGKCLRDSAFAGQLLVSAKVERTQRPLLGVSVARNAAEPTTQPHVLRVDVAKIALDMRKDDERLPSQVYLTVEIGSQKTMEPLRSLPALRVPGSAAFRWDPPEDGRLDEVDIPLHSLSFMPDDKGRLCIICSIYTEEADSWMGSEAKRYMFCAVPVIDVLNWDTTSKWYNMYHVNATMDSLAAGIILMNINVGLKQGAPKRRDMNKIRTAVYYFRASIYQATNLPPAADKAFPDAFVIIEFGSEQLVTRLRPQEVCPDWFEVCEAQVTVPVDEQRRPAVQISILDKDEHRGNDMIAKMSYPTQKPGSLKGGQPMWHQLQPKPGAAPTTAQLLASFELISPDAYVPSSGINVATQDCRVELYVIGVRFQKNSGMLQEPVVNVSWARGKSVVDTTSAVGVGGGGQFNFMKKLVLEPCALATNPICQDWLHIRLIDLAGEDEDLKPVAHATLHLTPRLPWLDEKAQLKSYQQFRSQRESLLRAGVKELPVAQAGDSEDEAKSRGPEPAKGEGPGAARGERRSRRSTRKPIPNMGPARGKPKPPSAKGRLKQEEQELAKAAGWKVECIEASNAQLMEERLLDHSQKAPAAGGQGDWGEDEYFRAELATFLQAFSWPLHSDEDQTLANRTDLGKDFETHSPANLPYQREPLYMEDTHGLRLEVGVLKYKLRIVSLADDPAKNAEEDMRWRAAWEKLCDEFRRCVDLRLRAYMLSADGLLPKSGNRDCSTFLFLMAGVAEDGANSSHRVSDDTCIQEHTVNPEFMKCYPFDRIEFPQNALMRFAVMEASAGGEQIGSTVVDIEDRWFHQKYRAMVEQDEVPIETRVLYDGDSVFSKGHLRMWLEVLTEQQAGTRPDFTPMPSNEPAFFQLRVVIWKTHQVTWEDYSGEERTPNLYVTGSFKLDDDTVLQESTDTHSSAREGNGTFNWRMLFDIRIPSKNRRLLLQVWNWDYLGSSEICNVKLDLASDFSRARKNTGVMELPRGRVPLTNPAFQGKTRGFLELEASLWPMEEAKVREAGRGREEPNEEPFCDPMEPALLEGRKGLGGVNLFEGIADAGQWAYSAAKFSAMLYILFYAIGFLVSSVIAIVIASRFT